MKRVITASLTAAGLLLAQAATADVVFLSWQGPNADAIKLSIMNSGPFLSDYPTSTLSYLNASTGASLLAFGIEPQQPSGLVGVSRVYSVGSFVGAPSANLQSLFSNSYASLSSSTDKAAFQLAVWEFMFETSGNYGLTSGNLYAFGNDSTTLAVAAMANDFVTQALAYTGPAQYTLTRLSNASYQDIVTASPVAATVTAAVPEPASSALMLAGLVAVGWVSRRRAAS